jgi:GT2 family glycosyltransferase
LKPGAGPFGVAGRESAKGGSPPPRVEDRRDELFSSAFSEDVFRFYDGFSQPEELVRWMRSRPPAPIRLQETEGEGNVVVVVPTASVESTGARRAREMYRGTRLILVESSGRFFNYSRSCNQGIALALRHSPDWIVLANDDLFPIDPFGRLVDALSRLDPMGVKTVRMRPPGRHYSHRKLIGRRTRATGMLRRMGVGYGRAYEACCERLGVRFEVWEDRTALERFEGRVFLGNPRRSFWNMTSFGVLSAAFVGHLGGPLFDEGYINGYEDVEVALGLAEGDWAVVDFRIGGREGSSLGRGRARSVRDIANLVYLNSRLGSDGRLLARSSP